MCDAANYNACRHLGLVRECWHTLHCRRLVERCVQSPDKTTVSRFTWYAGKPRKRAAASKKARAAVETQQHPASSTSPQHQGHHPEQCHLQGAAGDGEQQQAQHASATHSTAAAAVGSGALAEQGAALLGESTQLPVVLGLQLTAKRVPCSSLHAAGACSQQSGHATSAARSGAGPYSRSPAPSRRLVFQLATTYNTALAPGSSIGGCKRWEQQRAAPA